MKMINVIVNFRRYLKRRNYSPHTLKYYLNLIRQFVLWIDVPLEHAGVDKIEDYIDYLHQKRLLPASINLYLAIIRVFYNYLKYEEKIKLLNPVKANCRLRVPKPLPRALREDQVDAFFDVIKTKRDWAMFRLMLRCGLRVEEVANLTLGDIDLKQRRIMVIDGKGGKDRVVYISHDAADGLIAYLKRRSHRRVKRVSPHHGHPAAQCRCSGGEHPGSIGPQLDNYHGTILQGVQCESKKRLRQRHGEDIETLPSMLIQSDFGSRMINEK
jgi:site-specific recombinase XerD